MGKLLVKLFVKNSSDTSDPAVRRAYGTLAGVVGIVLNILLAVGKICAGVLSGALSVTADGLNNLTDCGSNAVSVIGFKVAGKPADKEHPYGHQRMEYIAAMIVAFIVFVVAIELGVESVQKLIEPTDGSWSITAVIVLSVSVAVKLWMFFFNRSLAKKISSEALKATATDSISDAGATAAVLVALIISHYTDVDLDGVMGLIVAVLIAFAGIGIFRSTLSQLLGKAPDKAVLEDIKQRIRSHNGVLGIHDLNVHSYGKKLYATAHVEVDARMGLSEGHDLADGIERDFAAHTDVIMVVHVDPIQVDDPVVERYRDMTAGIVRAIDPSFSIHDFRVVDGAARVNLIFDVAMPFEAKISEAEVERRIKDAFSAIDGKLYPMPTVERQISA